MTGDDQVRRAIAESGFPEDYFRRPSPSRVWNYWLGGKDNYPADREVGDVVSDVYPGILTMAAQSRHFLVRTVRFLAEEVGIRQFLDIGGGLPEPGGRNTHQIAQAIAPESKVVYIDNDPVVLAHANALMTSTTPAGVSTFVDLDYRETGAMVAEAGELLDFSQPISVMFMGVFGYLPDFDEMRAIIERTVASVPPGSHLSFWDGTDTSDAIRDSHRLQAEMGHPYTLRTIEEIESCFTGLELLEPGVVQLPRWRPELAPVGGPLPRVDAYGGVARKP